MFSRTFKMLILIGEWSGLSLCRLNFFMKEKQKRQEVINTQAGTLLVTQEEEHQFQELL